MSEEGVKPKSLEEVLEEIGLYVEEVGRAEDATRGLLNLFRIRSASQPAAVVVNPETTALFLFGLVRTLHDMRTVLSDRLSRVSLLTGYLIKELNEVCQQRDHYDEVRRNVNKEAERREEEGRTQLMLGWRVAEFYSLMRWHLVPPSPSGPLSSLVERTLCGRPCPKAPSDVVSMEHWYDGYRQYGPVEPLCMHCLRVVRSGKYRDPVPWYEVTP